MRSKNNFKEYLKGFGIACCIWVFAIACFILPKYKFGYAKEVKMPEYKHTVSSFPLIEFGDVFKLNNGNILFAGERVHGCYGEGEFKKTVQGIHEEPFEIYNPNTGKVIESFSLPSNLMYFPKALLLDNNKLLLVNAYAKENAICSLELKHKWYKDNPVQYNSMILYDLNTKQVEKVIKKKINKLYADKTSQQQEIIHDFALLNNGIVLLFDSFNKVIERFDLENGTSELITNLDVEKRNNAKILPYKEDKALIFDTDIKIYDDLTKTVKPYRKLKIDKNYFIDEPKFISENEIHFYNNKSEMIYDIEKDQLKDLTLYAPFLEVSYIASAENISDRYLLTMREAYNLYFGNGAGLYIFDKEKNKAHRIFDIKGNRMSAAKIIKIDNGDLFIYGRNAYIFKPWKWVK